MKHIVSVFVRYTSSLNVKVSEREAPSIMLSKPAATAGASQLDPSTTLILSLELISTPEYVSVFDTPFTNTSFAPDEAVTSGRPNTIM